MVLLDGKRTAPRVSDTHPEIAPVKTGAGGVALSNFGIILDAAIQIAKRTALRPISACVISNPARTLDI